MGGALCWFVLVLPLILEQRHINKLQFIVCFFNMSVI